MSVPLPEKEEKFTYADYCSWPSDERWEIIEGVPYAMSPAPSTEHQRVLRRLITQIANALEDKPCEPFIAPFDVVLLDEDEKAEDAVTVVQPDIAVICDPSKIDEKGCKGAPDWIIEIISPSSARHDLVRKLALYENCGVKEYWVVHPIYHVVTVHLLGDDGHYMASKTYDYTAQVAVSAVPDLVIDLGRLFPDADAEEQQSLFPASRS